MIRLESSGAVLRVTLNRPEKRNAIDELTIAELRAAIDGVSLNAAVRVVLIAGEGADFCAGMDLVAMAQSSENGALEFLESAERLADLYRALRDCPKPVVAAVKGRALGGGCGLAMACDAVLATESAQFGFPEVKIGFVPAIVMCLLRRSVGEKRAFDLLASGEPVNAREACDLGMITRVFPDADFDASVDTYVAALAAKSGSALELTKKLFYAIDGMSFEAALRAGAQVNAIARTTADARRGFEEFGKRKR
ncbi:MAG TPA: enoyl-CoA hydratase-related protein [Bryobacteraceae bacterium]